MGARNQYSSINFLGGFIEGISMVNFFVGHFYTVVFGCGEITSKTSTMCKMQIAAARATQLCTHLSLLSRQTKNPLAIAAWKPWVTDRRWKIQEGVLHGIYQKLPCTYKCHTLRFYRCAKVLLRPLGSLRKPRRRRQRQRRQTKDLMSRTITVLVRYNSLYISLPSSAKQEREMTKFCVVWRTWIPTANFLNFYFGYIDVS